jgi:hypothetical protein
MNIFVRRVIGFGLFGLMAGAGALQAGQQAKFHLPFAATWGKTVLPAGDYSVVLPSLASAPHQFFLKGEGVEVLIMPMATSTGVDALLSEGRSYLKLVNVDGMYYVKSYDSGPTGTEFSFKVPREEVRTLSKREVVKVGLGSE